MTGNVQMPPTLNLPSSNSVGPSSAAGFQVCDTRGYKIITPSSQCIGKGAKPYVLYPRAETKPDLGTGYQYFGVPLQSVLASQTVPISFIEKLGARNSLKVLSEYTTSSCAQKLVTTGGAVVYDNDKRLEQAATVEAVVTDRWGTSGWEDVMDKVICADESYEASVLAQAEWIKFWGFFFDKSAEAASDYCETEGRYSCNAIAASSVASASSHLTASYTYQVPTAVFASFTTYGGSSWDKEAYQISTAAYKVALVQDAGGTYPDLSAYASYKGWNVYEFLLSDKDAVAAFHAAIKDVDVIIDEGSAYGSTWEETKTRFKSEEAASAIGAFTHGKVYTLDKTMDKKGTGGTGSDWFESRFAEPDALLEDMIAVLHKGSKVAAKAPNNYLRDVNAGATVTAVDATMCQGELSAVRAARSTTCAAQSEVEGLGFLKPPSESLCTALPLDAVQTCAAFSPMPPSPPTPPVAPIPEGSTLVHTVTFKTVIDMDASSFDSRAYIANLAAGLDGVTADQISVTVSGGSLLVHTVSFKTVIDMDASSFDSQAYIAKLAAGLDGVTADQISVTVSSGSVLLTTVITANTQAVARSTERFIATSTAKSLSAVVGVTITNLEAPTRGTAIAKAPAPADNTALIIGLAVGLSALVLVIIGIVVVMKCQGTKGQAKAVAVTTVSTTATASPA